MASSIQIIKFKKNYTLYVGDLTIKYAGNIVSYDRSKAYSSDSLDMWFGPQPPSTHLKFPPTNNPCIIYGGNLEYWAIILEEGYSGNLTISCDTNADSIELYDIQGRLLTQYAFPNPSPRFQIDAENTDITANNFYNYIKTFQSYILLDPQTIPCNTYNFTGTVKPCILGDSNECPSPAFVANTDNGFFLLNGSNELSPYYTNGKAMKYALLSQQTCTYIPPTTTPAPTTPAPTTHAPTTPAPTTPAPTTPAPTTPAPTTPAPTTPAPTTHAPTTPAPTTHAPTTHAPTTPAPTTHSPTTTSYPITQENPNSVQTIILYTTISLIILSVIYYIYIKFYTIEIQ
jgi:hypothetical protein